MTIPGPPPLSPSPRPGEGGTPALDATRAARLLDRLLSGGWGIAGPPRLLVVVAHPDDETIGAGALLARCAAERWVVHATDGSPRDRRFVACGFAGSPAEYARLRRRETAAALALAGLGPERLRALDLPDQEAAAAMARLAGSVAALCREIGPDLVLTHAYEGGHPDHDAVAFAVHAAAVLLRGEGSEPPAVAEMALYHAQEEGDRPVACRFLPPPEPGAAAELRVGLTARERELKARMLACHQSQRETLAQLPALEGERFRPAPAYDFTRPPHAGRLQYERWGFPLEGERFRALARQALAEVGLAEGARL